MTHTHSVYDTDKHFVIDPNTRYIKAQSDKVKLMQNDHDSTRLSFEIPRYVEGHDMSKCTKVEVHYINTSIDKSKTNKDVYKVKDLQLSPDSDDTVIFSWLISKNATKLVGLVNFIIRFSCLTGIITDYIWNTEVSQDISVATCIDNGEEAIVDNSDILEAWKEEVLADIYASRINLSNALIGNARSDAGNVLQIDDISPVENTMQVAVSFSKEADEEVDVYYLTGHDLLIPSTSAMKCHLTTSSAIISYLEKSQNWDGDRLCLLHQGNKSYTDYNVYIQNHGNRKYTIQEYSSAGYWETIPHTLAEWMIGRFAPTCAQYDSDNYIGMTEEGLYLIMGLTPDGHPVDQYVPDMSQVVVYVSNSNPPTITTLGEIGFFTTPGSAGLKLPCQFSTEEELIEYLDLTCGRGDNALYLMQVEPTPDDPEYWIKYFVMCKDGEYLLCETNNMWGSREFSISDWFNGTMDCNYYESGYESGQVTLTTDGARIVLGEYENSNAVEYYPNADGVITGVQPFYPSTVIWTNTASTVVTCTYNRDINKAFTELYNAIISMGGNI